MTAMVGAATDTTCPTCGLVLVALVEPRIVCITRHHDRCCHAMQRIRCADGSTQIAVASVDCRVVDVYPTGADA